MVDQNSKQSEINKILVNLSEKIYDPDEMNQYINKFIDIYDSSFRHSYSQIFGTLENQILHNDRLSIENLSANMDTLYNIIHDDSFKNRIVIVKFEKLYDHVMLEVTRIGYFNNQHSRYDDIDAKLKQTSEKINEVSDKSKHDMKVTLKKAKTKIDLLRTESITVLSILAAVMLVGIGSFTALGSIFNNIHQISMYKFFACAAFIGLILFNVVFMLLYMIARITEKNIYMDFDEQSNNCCGLNKIKIRLPYVYWFNLIDICVIIFSLSIEYIVMKYAFADWICILVGFGFMELAIYYGIKNSKI